VQAAFAVAVERWAADGVPDDPAAWIYVVARNRALDELRRRRRLADASALEALPAPAEAGSAWPDDRLALVFACCHPALAPEARIALTLRHVGGLTTAGVARAFLVSESAMAQRLVRARTKLREAGIGRPPLRGPAHALPRLHGGLRRPRRRPVRGGHPPRAPGRGARAGGGRGARAAGAPAPAGLAPSGALRR
jgi:RNA polymerase sigma-70 factor (ECF subfamily)